MDASEREAAVTLARQSLEKWVKERKRPAAGKLPAAFGEKHGCFVTLRKAGELRGCIGFPEPVLPLAEAICEAAKEASEDPRFPPIRPDELKEITIEVSVLTVPVLFKGKREALPKTIKIGKDGLIIRSGYMSGLLLPQVATEWGFGPEEFLDQACIKAGLQAGAWMDKQTEVLIFQAEVFSEEEKLE
jgi:hypothetical protein